MFEVLGIYAAVLFGGYLAACLFVKIMSYFENEDPEKKAARYHYMNRDNSW